MAAPDPRPPWVPSLPLLGAQHHPAERTELTPHRRPARVTTAPPRLTAAGSGPMGGLGAGDSQRIGSRAPHTFSPPLSGARGGASAVPRPGPGIGWRLLGGGTRARCPCKGSAARISGRPAQLRYPPRLRLGQQHSGRRAGRTRAAAPLSWDKGRPGPAGRAGAPSHRANSEVSIVQGLVWFYFLYWPPMWMLSVIESAFGEMCGDRDSDTTNVD